MSPTFSKYLPSKASNNGHVSKIKNVKRQYEFTLHLLSLFEIENMEIYVWIMTGSGREYAEFIDQKLINEIISLGGVKCKYNNSEIKISIDPSNISDCIDLIAKKSESLNWLDCCLNLTHEIEFKWKDSFGKLSIEYAELKLNNKRQDLSRISINNGNWPHVMTDFLIPGDYKDIEKATGVLFYFATPHHAWERGTNENTNGLIRQYIPKRTSMEWVTQAHCDAISTKLNDRPRKRLNYDTPRSRSNIVA